LKLIQAQQIAELQLTPPRPARGQVAQASNP
jgi:hypothetical protein